MRQIGTVLLSALLMWMSFPPLDWGFIIFIAPAPFLWALRRAETAREAGWLGFLFGFVFFGSMLSWIFVLGGIAWFPLTIMMALYATLYGLAMYLARTWSVWRWWVMAMGMWALWDWLRQLAARRIPMGCGRIPDRHDVVAQGFGAMDRGIWLGCGRDRGRRRDRPHVRRRARSQTGRTRRRRGHPADAARGPLRPERRRAVGARRHRSRQLSLPTSPLREREGADLLVAHGDHLVDHTRNHRSRGVGEDSFGGEFNPTYSKDTRDGMASQAVRIGATLIAGGTRPGVEGTFDNYNVVFAPNGVIIGEYKKRHPVPFGEYVPFRRILEFVPQLDQVPNDMNRGTGPVVFPITVSQGSGLFGSVISFEAAFARTIRSEVQAGAQLIVVNTQRGFLRSRFGVGSVDRHGADARPGAGSRRRSRRSDRSLCDHSRRRVGRSQDRHVYYRHAPGHGELADLAAHGVRHCGRLAPGTRGPRGDRCRHQLIRRRLARLPDQGEA